MPPERGRGAPVVLGNVIGRPLRLRIARNPNAWASSASADHPPHRRQYQREQARAARAACASRSDCMCRRPRQCSSRVVRRQAMALARSHHDRGKLSPRHLRCFSRERGPPPPPRPECIAVERFRWRPAQERMREDARKRSFIDVPRPNGLGRPEASVRKRRNRRSARCPDRCRRRKFVSPLTKVTLATPPRLSTPTGCGR